MEVRNKGYVLIAIERILWSTIGLFSNNLMESGLNPSQVAFVRLSLWCIFLIMYSLIKQANLLKISKKGLIYSIINKNALKDNESITLLIDSFLFGSIFMIPISNPIVIISQINNQSIIFNMLSLGLFTATLAYIFYMKGISEGVELSVAGVIASVELIFAQLIGWVIIGESFSLVKLCGLLFR